MKRIMMTGAIAAGVFLSAPVLADEDVETEDVASEPQDSPDCSRDFQVSPLFTYGSFRTDTQSYRHLVMGAEAGLSYRQKKFGPKLKGQTRAVARWQVGSNVRGRELRVGSFMGPWVGPMGLSVGPDFFISSASYGDLELGSALGVALPVIVTGDIKLVTAYAGVIPAWYLSGDREGLEGDGFLGIGDEQAFVAGVNIRIIVAHLGLSYYLNEDAYGAHHQVGVSVGLGM